MAAVGDMQLIAGRNMLIRIVNDLVPAGDVVYITNPQALLSLKHTGPVLKLGHDDETHNWSAYLMQYDTIVPWQPDWYIPPSPNEQARQARLAALQQIQARQLEAIYALPRIPDREIWMP